MILRQAAGLYLTDHDTGKMNLQTKFEAWLRIKVECMCTLTVTGPFNVPCECFD